MAAEDPAQDPALDSPETEAAADEVIQQQRAANYESITANDEGFAYKLQQEEMVGAHSVPVYASHAQDSQALEEGLAVLAGTAPLLPGPQAEGMALGDHERRLLETYSLGRGVRVIALIDGMILLFDCLLFPVFFVLMWGPLAGYLGSSYFRFSFVTCYFLYYVLKMAADIIFILYGAWWFLAVLVIDLWIARWVYMLAALLWVANP
ncbi:unnamed protein product, partial [Heterosigma akashiwo]